MSFTIFLVVILILILFIYRQCTIDSRSSQDEDDIALRINSDASDVSRDASNCLSHSAVIQSSGEPISSDPVKLAKPLGSQRLLSHDQSHNHNNQVSHPRGLPEELNSRLVLEDSDSGLSGSSHISNKADHDLRKESLSKSADCVRGDKKRRPSVVLVDSSGNSQVLSAPSDGNSTEDQPDESGATVHGSSVKGVPESDISGMSPASPSAELSHFSVDSCTNRLRPRTKHAPKIMYSHSEDKLMTSSECIRPICPSLPYSPYASPSSSPRLQRQPTKETRRLSFTESEDGWTQLNQYKLKDEIGKVSIMETNIYILFVCVCVCVLKMVTHPELVPYLR